jgi:hypothetical protein
MKTIKYTPEPNKKPQLSEAQEARLASLSDEDIDYSDIEELDDEFWEKAERVSLDSTQSTTLRVRSPILKANCVRFNCHQFKPMLVLR